MIKYILIHMLGRPLAYRLGRALYMEARNDVSNDIPINGELLVQQSVVEAWISKFPEDNLVVFDCGANVGNWSLPLLLYCRSKGRDSINLHAFEPVPSTAQLLKNKLLEFSSITFSDIALSSESGEIAMNIVGEGAGTNSLHSENPLQERQVLVQRLTASDYCQLNNIKIIHLFKCDTEGHDMEVIKGALPLLEEGRIMVLQFEYNHRWIYSRHFLKDVFDVISETGYRLGKICPKHIELYDKWYPELDRFFEANYCIIKDEAINGFKTVECRLDKHNAILP